MGTQLHYWGIPITLPSLTKSSADFGESYPTIVELLDVYRALLMVWNRQLMELKWSEPPVTLRWYSYHPTAAPALVRCDSTVRRWSCVLPSKVWSIGTLPQHHMSCGCPTDQKLFAGYIRSVRVTASCGATWIIPGNHLRAYFDLRVVVWSPVAGLGLVFVTGPSGPRKTWAPGPIPRPDPLNGPRRGVFFEGSLPLPPAPPVPQTGPR